MVILRVGNGGIQDFQQDRRRRPWGMAKNGRCLVHAFSPDFIHHLPDFARCDPDVTRNSSGFHLISLPLKEYSSPRACARKNHFSCWRRETHVISSPRACARKNQVVSFFSSPASKGRTLLWFFPYF